MPDQEMTEPTDNSDRVIEEFVSFDDTSAIHVQTGDDSLGQHGDSKLPITQSIAI